MTKPTHILFLALALGATLQCLAQAPEPFEVRRAEAVFEELPELKASEILKPELVRGPHYVVRDPVQRPQIGTIVHPARPRYATTSSGLCCRRIAPGFTCGTTRTVRR